MRVTAEQVQQIMAGYILIADIIGQDMPEFYTTGDRTSFAGLLAELTSRPEVLQVHSRRLVPHWTVRKSVPTPIIAEDFGTMAGYLWSGDEFALDGRGDTDA